MAVPGEVESFAGPINHGAGLNALKPRRKTGAGAALGMKFSVTLAVLFKAYPGDGEGQRTDDDSRR
jgi:hypothetical protein